MRTAFTDSIQRQAAEISAHAPGLPLPDYEALAEETLSLLVGWTGRSCGLVRQDIDYLARILQATAGAAAAAP